jgi:hypothetical protein
VRRHIVPVFLLAAVPLSLLTLPFWVIFCASLWFEGPHAMLIRSVDALMQWTNWGYSTYPARLLIGAAGAVIGWAALLALAITAKRPWSRVSWLVKAGYVAGAISMLIAPVSIALAVPPIALGAMLLWMAWDRQA